MAVPALNSVGLGVVARVEEAELLGGERLIVGLGAEGAGFERHSSWGLSLRLLLHWHTSSATSLKIPISVMHRCSSLLMRHFLGLSEHSFMLLLDLPDL